MARPKCWIGVAAREHVLRGIAEGFVMFAHGHHIAATRVQPGDWFAYYAPTQHMEDKDAVRRFVAIGRIAPGEPVDQQMSADTRGWRRAANYLAAEE
ncbi:MAG TPA: EVE domain-containing protein, partial [Devosia sp.]|nr:EVE domain-containing protein [Devosia sp.]